MSKRFIIEVPDALPDTDLLDLMEDDRIISYRHFSELQTKDPAPLPSALADERIDEVADVPDEAEVMRQCSALSKQLALLGKKKQIDQRK